MAEGENLEPDNQDPKLKRLPPLDSAIAGMNHIRETQASQKALNLKLRWSDTVTTFFLVPGAVVLVAEAFLALQGEYSSGLSAALLTLGGILSLAGVGAYITNRFGIVRVLEPRATILISNLFQGFFILGIFLALQMALWVNWLTKNSGLAH